MKSRNPSNPTESRKVHSKKLIWQRAWCFMVSLKADFMANKCMMSAAALTYMTLFAIVPLMTVIYAVFSMIPAFDGVPEKLQQLLFAHLIPQTGQEVQSYLADFSQQARSLTGLGVGFLLLTALLMLMNIEKTFNTIWGVQKARRGLSSFMLYWAVLSIGPLLLGAGIAISTYVISMQLFAHQAAQVDSPILTYGLPLILMSILFTFLFAAVPNCKVPLRFALLGGCVTALFFQMLKSVFGILVANSSYYAVYGAFAAVPLLLLWINFAWILILAGAILVRNLAERSYRIQGDKFSDTVAALKCLHLFIERSRQGESVADRDVYQLGLGLVHWQGLRHKLEEANWLITTSTGDYVLSRDMASVTLWDLAQIIPMPLAELEVQHSSATDQDWWPEFSSRREQLKLGMKESLAIPIETLLKQNSRSVTTN
jgi:membrane protein